MTSTRLVSVLGLGFGDCGKGLFVDYLCRRWRAHTVVRFNGGAQAGHNVVLPDGRHHTFSQFGAGSFVAGVATLLAYPVIVHPTALLVEEAFLRRAGVHDGLRRMMIDGRCRVTTPFHQAAGRMRELERGAQAHGSCGVGVGETVRHGLEHPQQILRYADLETPAAALEKLDAIRRTLLAQFEPLCAAPANDAEYAAELLVLRDASMAWRWLERARELTRIIRPATRAMVAERLHRAGTVLFEGAQGVLLDEWRGFRPHTTWSSIHPESVAAVAVAADAGQHGRIEHLGVLRSYMARHGQGPLPSHDPALDRLAEPHNASAGWQGNFRRGHPDAVLLRYALAVAGPLDGLLVSHLDVFDRENTLRWCVAYDAAETAQDSAICLREDATGLVKTLLASAENDLAHQALLAGLLASASPHFETGAAAMSASTFVADLERLAKVKVLFGAFGATHQKVGEYGIRPSPP